MPGIPTLVVGSTYPLDGNELESWMTRQLTHLALDRLNARIGRWLTAALPRLSLMAAAREVAPWGRAV
jgi:hypothetical protein